MKRLDEVPRDLMVRAGIRLLRKHGSSVAKTAPVWVAVVDLCGVGSTSACAICRELGLDPDTLIQDTVV